MTLTKKFRTENLRTLIQDDDGLAANNKYEVLLPQLSGKIKADGTRVSQELRDAPRNLSDLCTSARIPGKNLSVADRNIGMEQIKVTNGYGISDITLSFYLTNEYLAKKYFQAWMDCIVTPQPPYTAGFHEKYAHSLVITQLDRLGNTRYVVELVKAYPTAVSDIELNNQAQTAAQELTVSLTYSNYFIK